MTSPTEPPLQEDDSTGLHDEEEDEEVAAAVQTTNQEEAWETIAKQGSNAVRRSRTLLAIVLLASTIVVSWTIYNNIRNDQTDDFQSAFAGHAARLVDSFHQSVLRKMQAMDVLSVAFTSYSIETNASFPFVTLPDFEVRSAGVRVLAESPLINICMLVQDDDRVEWEAYIKDSQAEYFQQTVTRDAQLREYQDSVFGLDSPNRTEVPPIPFRSGIANLKLPEGTIELAPNQTGPYLPIWQVSPAVPWPTSYNFNLYSHPSTSTYYKEAIRSGQVVLASADNFQDASFGSTTAYFQLVYTHSQYRHQIGEDYKGGPSTAFAYPMFDSFDPMTRQTVGIVSSAIYWRLHFANVLPNDAIGIDCVLSNSFNQTMTFRIEGGEAFYVGPGDHHDPQYDELEVATTVHDYIQSIASPETRAFTAVALNSEQSRYFLKIYPSRTTEQHHRNREPRTVTSVIIGVFAFTSILFFTYDFLVGQQQRFVMNRALASSAIVSSLFPAQVRETLYEENRSATEKYQSSAIDRFIRKNEQDASKPIVSRFENTSIFFADIAGFTKWSTMRTPEKVFVLLETLYQAFDVIAVRRNVFKVETIGDCYMAATGLPEPQEHHAVIMAKFASSCLNKSREIIKELTPTLGADTSDLDIRIGIHSGAVTGGVLRGQKSRFQLFGDTVNTASRMESTGVPGRIHVSEAFADALKRYNKGKWLTPRSDTIVAKGKGEMSTYWMTIANASASEFSSQVSVTGHSQNDE